MKHCPRCDHPVTTGDTSIGPWHSGCAPKDIRDAWEAGVEFGRRDTENHMRRLQEEIERLKASQAEVFARLCVVKNDLKAML